MSERATGPSPATRAITAGRSQQGSSLTPPLWATSVWQTAGLDDTRKRATASRADNFYSRYANPTVRAFEEAIADLEGAEDALAFASGMGAVASVVFGLCSSGDHIVAARQVDAGTNAFLLGPCARMGITVTWVDGTEPGAFAAAVIPGKTMLVIAESPSNPRLDLVDIDELGSITGPFTLVDSTFATPIGQQPIRHGVDIVLHSATKGICGHNDATLGSSPGRGTCSPLCGRTRCCMAPAPPRSTRSTGCVGCSRSPCATTTRRRRRSSWRWRCPRTPASPQSTIRDCRTIRSTTSPCGN